MTDSNQNNGADRTAKSSMTQRNAESSDAESQAPTITEQIYSFFQSERLDRGYGNYQSSRHPANIEPLEQLLRSVEKKAKDAKFRKPDKSSKTKRTK